MYAMNSIKKFSNLSNNLILCGIVILIFEGNAYAQKASGTESVKTLSDFPPDTELNKISYQKSSASFYRTELKTQDGKALQQKMD